MNKDVVYIEPEDDITDILAHIKDVQAKVVALVPPKKAGVLHSAVNFKLIAKAAAKAEKSVVLVSSDASLLRLAATVSMPVAKNLQSKPRLPGDLDADEFGADADDNQDIVEEDNSSEQTSGNSPSKNNQKHIPVKKTSSSTNNSKKPSDLSLSDEDVADDANDADKSAKKHSKIPDFKKYRKKIIAGLVAAFVIIAFLVWAFVFAPAVKIAVKVKTTANNFSESVSFVTDESASDPEKGIFYIEEKTITKEDSANLTATGEVDKGTKATGTITVVRPKGTTITEATKNLTIPKGTTFTYNGLSFVTTVAASANATRDDYDKGEWSPTATLKKDVSSGSINVVATASGDKYNIGEATSGWSSSLSALSGCRIASTTMTGGSSKIVKTVSQKDLDAAAASISSDTEDSVKKEFSTEYSETYILVDSSFRVAENKIESSPNLNEEVADGTTPKIKKITKYAIYLVASADIDKFMKAKVSAGLGDDTQQVYSTGVDAEPLQDRPFFDAFKQTDSAITAKLKGAVSTGPRVTEQMVSDRALGKKIGEVQTMLKSINGVSSVDIDTSYFWVSSVPSDANKVKIEITVEQ